MAAIWKVKRNNIFKDVSCRICGSTSAKILYRYKYPNGRSDIVECSQCSHMFIDPLPLQSLEERNMDTIEDAEMFGSAFLKMLYEKLFLRKEIGIVRKLLGDGSLRVLDIGCGTGWITSVWEKSGFIPTGLEPSSSRAKLAMERYDFKVEQSHIETYEPEEKFDIAIMRHVLEHVEDPLMVLDKVREFIRPGGLIMVVLPNVDCIARYIFKEYWAWGLPWHHHFFRPKTLRSLLESKGFSVRKLYKTPSPIWHPQSLAMKIGWNHPISKYFLHKTMLLNLLLVSSPIVLASMISGKSDNITLIAENVG